MTAFRTMRRPLPRPPARAAHMPVIGLLAVALTLDGDRCATARVAVGACGPTPFLVPDAASALVGSALEDRALEAAIDAVVTAAKPIDDVRGTRRNRLQVLRSLTSAAATDAFSRAVRRAETARKN